MEQDRTRRWTVDPEDAWRLLVEPMDQQEAHRAAAAINESLPHVQALPLDPRDYLLLAWDRAGVEMLIEALSALVDAGRPVPPRILTDLREWLSEAHPYDADDARWADEPSSG